jgi:hypothetical protein
VSRFIERLSSTALDICKSSEQDMTEEVHMDTREDQQTTERNDPAIDPALDNGKPENATGESKAPAQDQSQGGNAQSQAPAQDNPAQGNQSQDNKGATSTENSYTPDFEPEEAESADKTSEQKQTGETDGDIDTQGG